MSDNKQNKTIGIVVSFFLHSVLIGLLFLLAALKPVEKEEEGGGGGGNPAGAGLGAAPGEQMAMQEVEFEFTPMTPQISDPNIDSPMEDVFTDANSAASVNTSTQTTQNHTQHTTQTTTTHQTPSELDNALNALNGGGGSDNSTGGGTGGTGGGTGGGNGGGNGPGSGSFSGFGKGSGWSLKGRGMNTPPSTTQKPTASGKVVLNVLVDKNGNVIKADVASSTVTVNVFDNHKLARDAAFRAKFSPSQNSLPQQGQITIILSLN